MGKELREDAVDGEPAELNGRGPQDLGVTAVGHRRILLDAITASLKFLDTTERSVRARPLVGEHRERHRQLHGHLRRPRRIGGPCRHGFDPEELRIHRRPIRARTRVVTSPALCQYQRRRARLPRTPRRMRAPSGGARGSRLDRRGRQLDAHSYVAYACRSRHRPGSGRRSSSGRAPPGRRLIVDPVSRRRWLAGERGFCIQTTRRMLGGLLAVANLGALPIRQK